MENFINSVGIEKIILFVLIFNVVLLIGFIINIIKTNAISKKYKNFMQKLGEGKPDRHHKLRRACIGNLLDRELERLHARRTAPPGVDGPLRPGQL